MHKVAALVAERSSRHYKERRPPFWNSAAGCPPTGSQRPARRLIVSDWPTYCHVVANDGGGGLAQRVACHMHYGAVLDICVFPHADAVHVSCGEPRAATQSP